VSGLGEWTRLSSGLSRRHWKRTIPYHCTGDALSRNSRRLPELRLVGANGYARPLNAVSVAARHAGHLCGLRRPMPGCLGKSMGIDRAAMAFLDGCAVGPCVGANCATRRARHVERHEPDQACRNPWQPGPGRAWLTSTVYMRGMPHAACGAEGSQWPPSGPACLPTCLCWGHCLSAFCARSTLCKASRLSVLHSQTKQAFTERATSLQPMYKLKGTLSWTALTHSEHGLASTRVSTD